MEEMGGRLPVRGCGLLTTTNGRSSIWLMVLKIYTSEHSVSASAHEAPSEEAAIGAVTALSHEVLSYSGRGSG